MAASNAISSLSLIFAVSLLINAAAATNHTVGSDAGWFFDSATNRSSADYNAWATNQTFSLGDYLIFDTNTNHTVIQTYNETTYNSCSVDDTDTNTFQYDGGSNELGNATIIYVPLTIEGLQFYFSSASDGEQCQHGMAFEITVRHGNGLPPSLNQPPPPPYAPPPGSLVERESPPIVVVPTSRNSGTRTGFSSFGLVMVVLVSFSFLGIGYN